MTALRGRPRDPSRDAAILDAARAVIAQHGYTGASMEEIARSANVGKDTLYRRWTSKEQLAIDLIEVLARKMVQPVPLEPDPYFNLFVYLKDVVRLHRVTDFGAIVAGVVGEAARNDQVADAFRAFWRRRRDIMSPLVRDIVGPDPTDDDIEVLIDRLIGPLYLRLLFTGAEITDEYVWDLVVTVPGPSLDQAISDQQLKGTSP